MNETAPFFQIRHALDLGLQAWRTTDAREHFQDAMDALLTVERIGDKLAERLRMHVAMAQKEGVHPDDLCVICRLTIDEWKAIRGDH